MTRVGGRKDPLVDPKRSKVTALRGDRARSGTPTPTTIAIQVLWLVAIVAGMLKPAVAWAQWRNDPFGNDAPIDTPAPRSTDGDLGVDDDWSRGGKGGGDGVETVFYGDIAGVDANTVDLGAISRRPEIVDIYGRRTQDRAFSQDASSFGAHRYGITVDLGYPRARFGYRFCLQDGFDHVIFAGIGYRIDFELGYEFRARLYENDERTFNVGILAAPAIEAAFKRSFDVPDGVAVSLRLGAMIGYRPHPNWNVVGRLFSMPRVRTLSLAKYGEDKIHDWEHRLGAEVGFEWSRDEDWGLYLVGVIDVGLPGGAPLGGGGRGGVTFRF